MSRRRSRIGYRLVQEGLTNALRHAPGAPVQVVLRVSGGTLAVEVTNASAPPSDAPPIAGTGTGLRGLRERVLARGGEMRAAPTAVRRLAADRPGAARLRSTIGCAIL